MYEVKGLISQITAASEWQQGAILADDYIAETGTDYNESLTLLQK